MAASTHVILPLHVGSMDLSVTKQVLVMWIVSVVIILFVSLATHTSFGKRLMTLLYDFIHDSFASSLHTSKKLWFSF